VSFADFMRGVDRAALRDRLAATSAADVERALRHPSLADDEVPALFSPAADAHLEEMAQRSRALTQRRFGRVMVLYAPLYLSNECVNRCIYCGFSQQLEIPRATLTLAQALEQAELLHADGFRHLLLVTGESRRHVGMDYLVELIRRLAQRFDAISIEIQPLSEEEYRALAREGLDGLTLYQEAYDPVRYGECHLAGPKRSFRNRLETIERGGRAGLRSLGIGALLGLDDWRLEATLLALHGRYLTRRFWRSRIAVSFPRIRDAAACYHPTHLVTDRDMVHMICAMRLILPDAELVLSTREPARLRDRLIPLGVTRMSAGSRTSPGGYGVPAPTGEQFEIEDARSPAEVSRAIAAQGYEPVWKDLDRRMHASSAMAGEGCT
jgi:2-iminoacetate synthase